MYSYDAFTISWTRAYSTSASADAIARLRGDSGHAGALTSLPHAVAVPCDDQFYDVQALDDGHVARLRTGGLSLAADLGGGRRLDGAVSIHHVFHAAGFMLLRLTIGDHSVEGDRPRDPKDFECFYETVWKPHGFTWTLERRDGAVCTLEAGVRRVMDWIFFDCHERLLGRPPEPATLERWTSGHDAARGRLEELRERGEVLSPYPVVFGAHYELVDGSLDPGTVPDWMEEFLAGHDRMAVPAEDIDTDSSSSQWYVGENKSVLLLPGGSVDSSLDAYSPDRVQLIEFLNLRRGALRVIQRETQVAITGGRVVTRRTLATWNRVLGALTDDYVLHDRIGQYLEPLSRYVHSAPRLRSLVALEEQVRRNLETFQTQIDAAAARAQIVVGILFGVVAAAALGPLVRRVMTRFLSVHLGGQSRTLVDLALVLGLSVAALLVLRRASQLRPSKAQRRVRLPGALRRPAQD